MSSPERMPVTLRLPEWLGAPTLKLRAVVPGPELAACRDAAEWRDSSAGEADGDEPAADQRARGRAAARRLPPGAEPSCPERQSRGTRTARPSVGCLRTGRACAA